MTCKSSRDRIRLWSLLRRRSSKLFPSMRLSRVQTSHFCFAETCSCVLPRQSTESEWTCTFASDSLIARPRSKVHGLSSYPAPEPSAPRDDHLSTRVCLSGVDRAPFTRTHPLPAAPFQCCTTTGGHARTRQGYAITWPLRRPDSTME